MNQQKPAKKSALERIDLLENEIPRLISAINGAFEQLNERVGSLAKLVEAVVETVGAEQVEQSLKAIEDRKIELQLSAAKAELDSQVAAGNMLKVEVVGEKSLIVGREFDREGVLIPPGRAQIMFASIKPEYQEKLKGQQAGFMFETVGGKFEVMEVYDEVVKAPEALTAVEAAPVEDQVRLEAALTPSEG